MMTPAEAQTYCTTLTKKSGSNFYYSFLFLPKARREAMYTVYALSLIHISEPTRPY